MRVIALCGIILTEILQGIADDTTHQRVRRYLAPLIVLTMPEAVFVRAADIYRKKTPHTHVGVQPSHGLDDQTLLLDELETFATPVSGEFLLRR